MKQNSLNALNSTLKKLSVNNNKIPELNLISSGFFYALTVTFFIMTLSIGLSELSVFKLAI